MTGRIPKVGDVYKCLDGSCRTAKTGELVRIVDVDAEDTFATYRTIEKNGQSHWSYEEWPEDFEYVSSGQQFEGKHYINVKAYAEKYGITMDKAQAEIQPKLFKLGYEWSTGKHIHNYNDCLVLNYGENRNISHINEGGVKNLPITEILIEREETVTLSLYVKEAPIEYVEFNGKQYEKAKLEQALKLIEGGE